MDYLDTITWDPNPIRIVICAGATVVDDCNVRKLREDPIDRIHVRLIKGEMTWIDIPARDDDAGNTRKCCGQPAAHVIPVEPRVHHLGPQLRKFAIKMGDVDGKLRREQPRDLL